MLAGVFLLGCHIYVTSEVVSDIATTNCLIIKNWGAYFYNINISYIKWLEFISVGTQYKSLVLADIYSILREEEICFLCKHDDFPQIRTLPLLLNIAGAFHN